MAEIRFKALLSCSFADEDCGVIDFFKKLITAFDIDTMIYNYQEIGRIPNKVKENIMKSDCLIAIATRRNKIEDTNYWTCPDWIQHEIALANAYGKPIAVFVEEGVKIEGLIAMEERREKFNRQNLIGNIDKIATFLFKLRSHLEFTYQTGMLEAPVLLRHYIHSKDEMVSKELTVERTEILMESLIDGLEATHHYIELEETTPNLSVKPEKFEFKCIEKPSNTKVEPVIVLNTEYKFFWRILFDPPLKKGERVKYAFKELRPNYRPFTYEELMERIKKGTYEYEEPKCEACEWTIAYPTYELRHEFEFPEKYEIENYYPDVVMGVARNKAQNEIKRINEENLFTAEKVFDKWILKLKVPKPLQNHTYYIYYVPLKNQNEKDHNAATSSNTV